MDDFLAMHIFFFVTTIFVALLGIAIVLITIRIVSILRSIERMLAMAEHETELVKEDIDDLRAGLRQRGFRLISLGTFVQRVTRRFTKHTRARGYF